MKKRMLNIKVIDILPKMDPIDLEVLRGIYEKALNMYMAV